MTQRKWMVLLTVGMFVSSCGRLVSQACMACTTDDCYARVCSAESDEIPDASTTASLNREAADAGMSTSGK